MTTLVEITPTPAPDLLVDQFFTEPLNLSSNINDVAAFIGQTYTAGVTGLLGGVSVNVRSRRGMNPGGGFNFYRLHVALCAVRDGFPGAVLTETTLDTDQSLLHALIRFPDAVPQVAGTRYAIVVHYADAPPAGPGQWIGNWLGATGDHYPGGDLFYGPNGRIWFASSLSDHDVHFRTYVLPA